MFKTNLTFSSFVSKKTQVSTQGFEHRLTDHTPSTLTLDYGCYLNFVKSPT